MIFNPLKSFEASRQPEISKKEAQSLLDSVNQEIVEAKGSSTLLERFGKKLSLIIFAMNILPGQANFETRSYDARADARQELKETGITKEQKQAYKPGISELMYSAITPRGYQNRVDPEGPAGKIFMELEDKVPNLGAIQEFLPNVILGREREVARRPPSEVPALEDAWRLYLGLPMQHDSFGVSDYKPAQSKEDIFYYNIKGFVEDLEDNFERIKRYNARPHNKKMFEAVKDLTVEEQRAYLLEHFNQSDDENTALHAYSRDPENLKEYAAELNNEAPLVSDRLEGMYWPKYAHDSTHPTGKKVVNNLEVEIGHDVMGNYTMSAGEDEKGTYVSYYDSWDLEGTLEGVNGVIGQPFEIYDRIYYNPETGEIIKD